MAAVTDSEWRQAVESWPGLTLDRARFDAFVAERGGTAVRDLYLSCACLDGVPGAVELFTVTYEGPLDEALRRVRADSALRDDAKSQVLARMLVGDGASPPKLAEYRGQGPLTAWLSVAVVRLALKLVRQEARYVSDEDAIREPVAGGRDAELHFVEARYRPVFERAFSTAWRALDAQDRNLLRFHFLDGMTTEELARLYNVHRATAVRWLAAARQALMAATRQRVRQELDLPADEFDSVMRLVRSRLSLSLSTMNRP